MTLYEVGSLYHPERRQWPETVDYNFINGEHELRWFMKNPRPNEIKDFQEEPVQFAVTTYLDVIVFSCKFGGMPWSDATFTIHKVPEESRTLPPLETPDGVGAFFYGFLINANTGILEAMRVCTFSTRFTRAIHTAINKQYNAPYSEDSHVHNAIRFMQAHTTKEIATKLSLARCEIK